MNTSDFLTYDKNAFAPLPPMGWNSYDYYDTSVTEDRVRANAAYMAEHLKEYGWEYVVVDIQWYARKAGSQRDRYQYIPFSGLEMDGFGRLLPDPERFPSSAGGRGFKPLADYVHNLGLKFGIHIMRGIPRIAAQNHLPVAAGPAQPAVTADQIADPSSICGWNPDMYGVRSMPEGQLYYDSLLELYAGWGVDYIKCDDICNTNLYPGKPYSARHEVEMLARAIRKTGRPIVLSLSPGPALIEQAWHYETYANLWRITDDLWDRWEDLKNMFRRCELWQNHVSRGCYPDCDMLPLGRIGRGFGAGCERMTRLTRDEQRTMLSLWCLFGSPLMLGAEMTLLDDWTKSLLTNRRILAMRSPEWKPLQLQRDDTQAVWAAASENSPLLYAAIFNLSDEPRRVSAETFLKLPENGRLTELWTDTRSDAPCALLPPHGCAVYLSEPGV